MWKVLFWVRKMINDYLKYGEFITIDRLKREKLAQHLKYIDMLKYGTPLTLKQKLISGLIFVIINLCVILILL